MKKELPTHKCEYTFLEKVNEFSHSVKCNGCGMILYKSNDPCKTYMGACAQAFLDSIVKECFAQLSKQIGKNLDEANK